MKKPNPMPEIFEPMLPTLAQFPFSNPGWLFEPKWDGYRAISLIENGSVQFISRRQNSLTKQFPSLQQIAKSVKAQVAVMDGEIVSIDKTGTVRFEGLRTKSPEFQIVYFAFDLLTLNGEDLTQLPLVNRKAALRGILPKRQTGIIRFTSHIVGDGESLFRELEEMKLEGMVAKRSDSVYVSGRTRAWLKIKTRAGKAEMQKRSETWGHPTKPKKR